MSARVQTQTKPSTAQASFSSVSNGLLQRRCACGGTPGMSGECQECSKKKRLGLQTKLKVNEPRDVYEQEADRIASQVLAAPTHPAVSGAPPRIQRFTGQSSASAGMAPASVDRVLASSGRPLEPALRQDMEKRFGHDFSRVRVHFGAAPEKSAQEVNANAYTAGHNIVFASGQYAPGSSEGRRLIAHELAHVVQQGGGSRKPGEARLSLSASPVGYVQRDPPQIPEFSKSTEDQIDALMEEHRTLSRVNAERAVQGPPGAVPQASGKGGTRVTGTGSGNQPKVADIEFRKPSARGSSVVLRREVKTWEGNQGKFNEAVGDSLAKLKAGGGGELLVQVPEGTDGRAVVQRFKGSVISSPQGGQKFGRYRSIKITIVDPSGTVLLDEPLEFPPSKIPPAGGVQSGAVTTAGGSKTVPAPSPKTTGRTQSGGGDGTLAPVKPLAQTVSGEVITGEAVPPKTTGRTQSGGGGGTLAPVKPLAQTVSGEVITGEGVPPKTTGGTPPGSSPAIKSGGLPKVLPAGGIKTAVGEVEGASPSLGASIGWAVAEFAILYLLSMIAGYFQGEQQERQMREKWEKLSPKVQEDLNLRQGDIEKVLRQTNKRKTIYANVQMDLIIIKSCYEGTCVDSYYGIDYVPPVKVSTENINRKDVFSSIEPAPSGNIIHYPVIYSFPIAEPASLVLPSIRIIHEAVAAIRTDLMAIRGRTAGEAVALDYLIVAQQATDVTDPNFLQFNTAAERFRLTIDAVTSSLSVLQGPAGENAALRDLIGRLWLVKFRLDGLANRWPLMV